MVWRISIMVKANQASARNSGGIENREQKAQRRRRRNIIEMCPWRRHQRQAGGAMAYQVSIIRRENGERGSET
jgi:hypothetical protein